MRSYIYIVIPVIVVDMLNLSPTRIRGAFRTLPLGPDLHQFELAENEQTGQPSLIRVVPGQERK